MALNESGKPREALADFSKAIDLDPNDNYPYEQRAQIYRKVLKDEAKARADLDRAAALREKRWEALPKLREQYEQARKRR
jgi:regulator of sirC expression with transglutaminase-like and TPR domain